METTPKIHTDFTKKYITIDKETNTLTLNYEGNHSDFLNTDIIAIYNLIGTLERFKPIYINLNMSKNLPVELVFVIGKVSNYCQLYLTLRDQEAYDHLQKINNPLFNFKEIKKV